MNPENFFAELKRRNVYKVAAAYVVAAWLLIQAASIIFPTFDAPAWLMKVLVGAVALGFPVTLVLAWAFEITPEGIKRDENLTARDRIKSRTGRKLVGVTIALAVVAAGLLCFQIWRRARIEELDTGSAKKEERDSNNSRAISPRAPEKSIAVLPFTNLSSDEENAYFADGIQDEILTRLSKIAALKVISRTSTQKYKSAPANLREIGVQLGVVHLVEGSVQRVANKVHINVQLIHAATDEHLWAESYNRTLDDVFAVEGEVASAIADQLQATLTGAEQKAISEHPTQNLAAYDAYLRALAIEHDRFSYSNFQEAAKAYAEAVRLDPEFAIAWSRLASVRSFLYFNGLDLKENSAAAVKDAVDRSVALQPDAGETWIALGAYRYRVLRDFSSALEAYDEARKRLPNNSYVVQYMAYVERRLGRWQAATEHYKKAAELDPRDFQIFVSMGSEFLNYLRRFTEAHAALDHALEISPNEPGALTNKALVFQSEGRLKEAAAMLIRIPNSSRDEFVDFTRVSQALYQRQFQDAIALIDANIAPDKNGALTSTAKTFLVQLGYCQEWIGQHNEATTTFTRAVQAIKPSPDFVVVPESLGLPCYLALAYAGLGDKEKALEQARRAVVDYETDAIVKPQAEAALAQIQARFGDLDSAIATLPHLLEVPAGITVADLRFNPFWDPLRQDPRFEKFLIQPSK